MARHSAKGVAQSIEQAEEQHDHVVARAVDLTKTYGDADSQVVALDHVNVEFQRGQMTAIMGPSGSGKSTLMHCMAGLDQPTSGKVFIEGLEVSSMGQKQLTDLRRAQIGFIFQSFNLVPTLCAEENILLPLQIAKKPIDRDWFKQVVKVVGLEKRLTHRPSQLSGGQQQRIAIARALCAQTKIILFDEPTSALDPETIQEVLDVMIKLAKENITMVVVTHEMGFARQVADRIVFMADGQIIEEGTPDHFFDNPSNERVKQFLGKIIR